MHTNADKGQKNQSVTAANEPLQSTGGGEATFEFVDNRAEAVQLRKLQAVADNSPQAARISRINSISKAAVAVAEPIQKKNNTGMPDNLKIGIETLSGLAMDDVKVHYNSPKPARVQALAYTKGTDINVGPGGEKHLPHEAWHVVQQKEGRVIPTTKAFGEDLNDDAALEKEADVMGEKALAQRRTGPIKFGQSESQSRVGHAAEVADAPIQARLPHPNYWSELNEAEQMHKDNNLTGIQNLLVRIYEYDLGEEDKKRLNDACNSGQVSLSAGLYGPPSETTEHVYNWMRDQFPRLVYPGPQPPTAPQSSAQTENHGQLVRHVLDTLGKMQDGAMLVQVFGEEKVGDAIAHINSAVAWVKSNSAKILGDQSGEMAEMMIGGRANFGGPVILPTGAFLYPPTTELITKTIHESLHAANEDVLDDGGYPTAPEDFKQRSAEMKIVNASHYEEVARRVLQHDAVGGTFTPAVGTVTDESGVETQVDTRKPAERAVDRVRSTIQIAWERSQNIHGFLKSVLHQSFDDREEHKTSLKPILAWSLALDLQIHRRLNFGGKPGLTVNHIDILQVESLTKTLGRMMKVTSEELLAIAPVRVRENVKFRNMDDGSFELLLFNSMVKWLVQKNADAKWLLPDPLEDMIFMLKDAPRDVREFVG